MTTAPTGTSACRRFESGISRPREENRARIFSTTPSSRSNGTFITSAMASRVMSSWVGPSPPHTITPSLRANAVRRASTMRSWLSPTAWWKCEATPMAARCSPIHLELVSAICPRSSSVPTATISMRTGVSDGRTRAAGRPAPPHPCHAPTVEVVLPAGEHRHGRGHPDRRGQHRLMGGQGRCKAHADGHVLQQGLHLRRGAGRDGHATSADQRPVDAHGHFAHGDDDHRWLPVVIIAVREVAMSVYRALVGRRGVSVPARTTAKVKTLLQDVAIGMCLAPPLATHQTVLATAIWVATAMTVFTGGQYYLDGRRVARVGRGGAADGSRPGVGPPRAPR